MIGSSLDILLWLPRAWFAYTTLNGTGVMGASNCVSVRIVGYPSINNAHGDSGLELCTTDMAQFKPTGMEVRGDLSRKSSIKELERETLVTTVESLGSFVGILITTPPDPKIPLGSDR